MSLTSIFDIGKSALFAYQKAMGITGHNIANVSTPGYSRQEAILAERSPENGRPGQIGTGVEVTQIRRQVDQFTEQALLNSREQLGQFDASRSALLQLQDALSPSSELGLSTSLNEFFGALQDVGTNPADPAARTVLLSKAGTLASRLNQTATTLDRQRVAVDEQIRQGVDDVNALAEKIAGLNQEISRAETSGQQANDLRDQRGRLLGDLANLLEISTLEDETGQTMVFVGRGQVLVAQGQASRLAAVTDASNGGMVDVRYDSGSGPVTDLTAILQGGRLKALLDVRDQTIPNTLASLDTFASTLVTQINTVHQAGFGLDGSTGLNVFTPSGTTARDISVALTDGRQIAASSTAAGVPGNNVNALALAALHTTSVAALGNKTFNGHIGALVSGIGSSAQAAERDLQAQEIVQEQLEARRAEVSGVSLDEELVNMIQQQRAFQAASKVIVTADEMLQTLLGLKR